MYDLNKRLPCFKPTVGAMIAALSELPQNAEVLFNGCDCGYIHVSEDQNTISFDADSLDEEYFEED